MTHKGQVGKTGRRVLYQIHHPKITNLARVFLLIPFLFSISVHAQTPLPVRIGLGGEFGSNISQTYIQSFAGDFLCGVFQKGSAPGISVFGMAEIPLPVDNFSFMPSLGYRNLSSAFITKPFNNEFARDIQTSEIFQVFRERNFTTNVQTITLDALLAWRPFSRLHLGAGAGVAYLVHHTFTQTEKILTTNAVYTDNLLSTREVSSGNFAAKNFAATVELGAGYDIALSPSVNISPQIRASFPLTPISSTNGSDYRTWTIGGVVALMYALPTEEKIEKIILPLPEPLPPIATPIAVEPLPMKSILRFTVKAVGITETGEEIPEPIVAIENVKVTDVAPTLNYLFFDDGSADIPNRYHSFSTINDTKSFDPSLLYSLNALGIHYEVLNILGKRMQEKPISNITITGTRSLHSPSDSAAAENISLLRAESTAKYLQNVWSIAPSRIKIKSRALPLQASDDAAATGQAENRRVEITTNTPSLLEPIETHRIERTATPPNIRFVSDIKSNAGIRSQIITIKQSGKLIKTINGLSPDANGELLWDIAEGNVVGSNDSVTWQMDLVDSVGNTASINGNIKIKKDEQNRTRHANDTTAYKSLERFHLLLFDYSSSAEINSASDYIFERIASSITPDSRVTLIGHTDVTGDPNYNEHLSFDRASRASLLLSSRLHKLGHTSPQFNLEARGAKDILFDNSNAEGRFLSRTVRITIERDLK